MWTLVIHHESDDCDEHYSQCQSEVDLYECESAKAVIDYLTDIEYHDKYADNGSYYWYLFQGKDLNVESSWDAEDTGGLDLFDITTKAKEGAELRREDVLKKKRQREEAEKQLKAEREKRSEERKVELMQNHEKTELDRLLRKHGLPDWATEVRRD